MDEQYSTADIKDLNTIGSTIRKFSLYIYLNNDESLESYYGRFENIVLVKGSNEYTFTPNEFIDAIKRATHTAKKVNVPRKDHLRIGHVECSECGTPIGYNNRFCHHCGARLLEDES
ncbi:hypothetical protein ACQCP0_25825 [Ralstonia pseudosolanacearum]|uniref:hypothetical protein n=1 Tax=Ralstonia pseudosolanacearum TaxID=1310165 RepID=UPI0031C05C6C|nr:zinc ribbon domain-containing protein [Akkermansia sp.]MBR3387510.1 zinc ribbon domain-containing protein [Bacteroidales bacterium]